MLKEKLFWNLIIIHEIIINKILIYKRILNSMHYSAILIFNNN